MIPGVVNRSTSTCQVSAASPTSSASSRWAASSVVLAVDVQQAGRRLDQPVPDGVPVLPDERDPARASSSAMMPTAPGCRRYSRCSVAPSGAVMSSWSERGEVPGAQHPLGGHRPGGRRRSAQLGRGPSSARVLVQLTRLCGLLDRQPGGEPAVQRRLDQPDEQRVRHGRPRLQLRVRLGGHEVRVHLVGQLDELDQLRVRRRAADHQAGLLQLAAVGVVDLVAVPVPLARPAVWPYRLATSEPGSSSAG